MAGRPQKISDEEIMREIATSRSPVATSPELSESLGINNSGMNKRLTDLVDRGLVKKRQVGASAVVYWLSDEGREAIN